MNLDLYYLKVRGFWIIQNQPQEVFFKKDILKILAKVTEKHLCRSFFLNKFHVKDYSFIKKGSGTGFFLRILWYF